MIEVVAGIRDISPAPLSESARVIQTGKSCRSGEITFPHAWRHRINPQLHDNLSTLRLLSLTCLCSFARSLFQTSQCPVDPANRGSPSLREWETTARKNRGVRSRRPLGTDVLTPQEVERAIQHLLPKGNMHMFIPRALRERVADRTYLSWALGQAPLPTALYRKDGRQNKRERRGSWRRRELLGLRSGRGV